MSALPGIQRKPMDKDRFTDPDQSKEVGPLC
jgi:hypothetical protein